MSREAANGHDGSVHHDRDSRPAPLKGVRVIDISSSYAGPTATMYLGDLGADVIKVERPARGDDARGWGPPFIADQAAWFIAANRNKRSVCIDLRSADGHNVLMRLLQDADVFVENLNPAKIEKLQLDPVSIRARFPRLIYCALSGFGLDGPARDESGYDLIAQARSGLMSVTGATGGAPQRVSTALSDISAGTVAALAVTAALYEQQRSGRGELIDVALLEADLALMAPRVASFLAGEPEPRPTGGTDSVLAIYQPFETADRPIVVAVGNDDQWERFCEALEFPELAAEPGLKSNAGRRAQRGRLIDMIAERLLRDSAQAWLARLRAAAIPSAPVQFLSEVVNDEQLAARQAIAEWDHPVAGPVRTVDTPWRLGGERRAPRLPAPLLGEHTVGLLEEAGYQEDEIADLLAKGAVWASRLTMS